MRRGKFGGRAEPKLLEKVVYFFTLQEQLQLCMQADVMVGQSGESESNTTRINNP